MAIFTGRRVRDNNVQGLISDNPLTAGATTLNSAGLGNMSAISGNHAVIVLDPLRVAGNPEIVIVTAHTASATSATITRGAYGTTARSHAQNVLWVAPAIDDDYVEILTANPSDNYEGQLWYRSDTDIFMAHNGTSAVEALPIGAWQSWTPTWTNLTVGSSTVVAKYTRIGRTIHWRMTVTLSGATVGDVRFTLPAEAAGDYFSSSSLGHVGDGELIDANGQTWNAQCRLISATTVRLIWFNTSANAAAVSSSAPFTWANTDGWDLGGTYEAAS